jgi:LCP family protein required for cell wall assembly
MQQEKTPVHEEDALELLAEDENSLEETPPVSDVMQHDEIPISEDALEDSSTDDDGSQPEEAALESQGGKKASKPKKLWSLKKKVIVTVACVFGALILGSGIFIASMLIDPMSHFETIAPQSSAPSVSLTADSAESPTPVPTLSEYDKLVANSDPSILENTVNILLIGVDYAPERKDWSGKHYYHSDVMIVLAINKETGSVNLISLPRDTYAEIPGADGIYKLNASMDCGGGWVDNPKEGCKKVCEAASWMIGGIPINYYYAVDMSAVKGLVNAIDGVDFNVDVDFKMQGRLYKAGMQHMDGQAVLDYLRARKDLGDKSGDLNRINRQKNMLVAILQKLKDSGLILKIPDIIGAFDGNLQTNVDLASTGALAAYAYNIDARSIYMYSMGGSMVNGLFNWNFVTTDQKNRVEIIKDVYGFDISNDADVQALEAKYGIKVPDYSHYSKKYALNLWNKMQVNVTKKQARKLLDDIKSILDADAQLPPYPEPQPVTDPVPVDPSLPAPEPTAPPAPVSSEGYRKYLPDGSIWALYNKTEGEYSDVNDVLQLQLDVQELCGHFGISKDWDKYWHVDYGDHPGKRSANQPYVKNDIPVDFD